MNHQLRSDPDGAWYLGEHLLHPGGDPLAAARRDLDRLLATAGPQDLLVLAGGGLGWHARAVLDAGGPALVTYEPDPATRRAMAQHGPACDQHEVAADPDALAELLARHLVYRQVRRVAVFAPPAYRALAPQVVETARQVVAETTRRRMVDQATRRTKNILWLQHLADNFKHILKLPDATSLAGSLAGVPALVVGAGPSLDQSLETIAANRDKLLIIAAASALAPLRSVGVYPEVAVALEARDESRQFAGADQQATVLAAASASNPRHFTAWRGMRAVYHLQPWMAELAGTGLVLPSGGHAGSAAFSLAIVWGCDPVVLVGQDLAYTGGRFHAGGRPGGENYDRPDTVDIPAIGGGVVPSSEEWISYIGWYQEAAGYLKRKGMGKRVVNATAAGAFIPGFAHWDLGRTLAGLSRRPPWDAGLRAALQDSPRPDPAALAQRLEAARAEAQEALARLAAGEPAPPGSAAAWVLEAVDPATEPGAAMDNLKYLLKSLDAMKEALHA